jgi:hypothetical protein
VILLLALLLSQPWEPARIEASLYVAAVAWGHDPAEFRALAEVESGMEANPRRYGKRERWGRSRTATTRPWRYLGLLQTREFPARPMGSDSPFPAGELLTMFPSLSAWYGAAHLAGWRETCGERLMYCGYNTGRCKPCTMRQAVERAARRGR